MPASIPAELSAHLQGLPANRGIRMASLTDWAMVRLMDRAIDAIGIDNIVASALAAYDKYVVPLDIPFIPDEHEPDYFDKPVKIGLEMSLRGFHDLIHAKAVGPLMAAAAPRTWIGEAA